MPANIQNGSFKAMVGQFEQLIGQILSGQKTGIRKDLSVDEVTKYLTRLQALNTQLTEAYKRTLDALRITEADVERFKANSDKMDPAAREMYQTLQALERQCVTAREELFVQPAPAADAAPSAPAPEPTAKAAPLPTAATVAARPTAAPRPPAEPKPGVIAHRRGKFKGMGGKKGWLRT